MELKNITRDDVIFFADMVGFPFPSGKRTPIHSKKPYYQILNKPHLDVYQRFIKIYKEARYVLNQREQHILDDLYGIHHPRFTFHKASKHYSITPERIRQICNKSEGKIMWHLRYLIKEI